MTLRVRAQGGNERVRVARYAVQCVVERCRYDGCACRLDYVTISDFSVGIVAERTSPTHKKQQNGLLDRNRRRRLRAHCGRLLSGPISRSHEEQYVVGCNIHYFKATPNPIIDQDKMQILGKNLLMLSSGPGTVFTVDMLPSPAWLLRGRREQLWRVHSGQPQIAGDAPR